MFAWIDRQILMDVNLDFLRHTTLVQLFLTTCCKLHWCGSILLKSNKVYFWFLTIHLFLLTFTSQLKCVQLQWFALVWFRIVLWSTCFWYRMANEVRAYCLEYIPNRCEYQCHQWDLKLVPKSNALSNRPCYGLCFRKFYNNDLYE